MFNFNLDFRKLINDILPPLRRKLILLDWIYALVSPIKTIHAQFMQLISKLRYDLQFNSQVIYLEYLLNLRFNGGLNTIFIADGSTATNVYVSKQIESQDPIYIVNSTELTPDYINVYVHYSGEFIGYADFIVFVPINLQYNEAEMMALINKYKLAGKIYSIKKY
jgi:hypothetical protein